MQEVFVGVDVAKDWLDVYHPDHGARRIENTPKAVRAFAASEATSGRIGHTATAVAPEISSI